MSGARDDMGSPPPQIFLISHNSNRRAILHRAAPDAQAHASLAEAFLAAIRSSPRAVVLDIGPLPDRTEDFIATLHRERPETAIYLVTEAEGEPAARSLVDVGASDYFVLPGDLARLTAALSSGRTSPGSLGDPVPVDPPPDRSPELPPHQPPNPPPPAPEHSHPSASEEPGSRLPEASDTASAPQAGRRTGEDRGDRPPENPERLIRLTLRDPETALLTVRPFEKCIQKMIDWAWDRDAEVVVVLMEAPAAASPETLAQLGRAVHASLTPQRQGGRLGPARFAVAWPRLLQENEDYGEATASCRLAADRLAAIAPQVHPALGIRTGVAIFPVDGDAADVLLKTAAERLQTHDSLAAAT